MLNRSQRLEDIESFHELEVSSSQVVNGARDATQNPLLSGEWHQRQVRRLFQNESALRWLTQQQVLPHTTIEHFGLGLTPPSNERDFTDALVFPRIDKQGRLVGHYLYYSIPGVTVWATGRTPKSSWATKPVQMYCSGDMRGKTTLLVVDEPKAVWAAAGLLKQDQELDQQIAAVSGTHGLEGLVEALALQTPRFWESWERVIFCVCGDETNRIVDESLQPCIGREVRLCSIPESLATISGQCPDWSDFLRNGDVENLRAMLEAARPCAGVATRTINGFTNTEEIDARNAYHKGHAYYSFETLVQEAREGEMAEEFRVAVAKTDGSILSVIESPRITNQGRCVRRLQDGVAVREIPKPPPLDKASWEPASIHEWCKAKREDRQLQIPGWREIVDKMLRHLKAKVWLPNEEDYVLLPLVIVTSYAQLVFSAVPLILLNGPKESGKSELCAEAAGLGCNGLYLSRTTLAGFIKEASCCSRLLGVDDVEELAADKGKDKSATNQFKQIVRTSYKQSTATQTLIGPRGESVRRNYYGTKIFNNTLGVDPITQSRMFQIHTRRRSASKKIEMEALSGDILSDDQIRVLRNRVHQRFFTDVNLIASTYKSEMDRIVDREDEIAAPLRTFALLTKDPLIIAQLEKVIAKRGGTPLRNEEQVFEDAICGLVAQGHRVVSAAHLINEMRCALGPEWGNGHAECATQWQNRAFITNKLISGGWVVPKHIRIRIHGEIKTRLRGYELRKEKVADIIGRLTRAGKTPAAQQMLPNSLCPDCSRCEHKRYCVLRENVNADNH